VTRSGGFPRLKNTSRWRCAQ